MAEQKLMTLAEVADYLGIPTATLYSWRSRAEGPVGIRVGRHVRYRPEAVEAYLEAKTDER